MLVTSVVHDRHILICIIKERIRTGRVGIWQEKEIKSGSKAEREMSSSREQ